MRTYNEKLFCDELEKVVELLKRKNKAYGNSALNPLRIFSKASPLEQIRVRIDDKLSRIDAGNSSGDEDTKMDLAGYLILERIAECQSSCSRSRSRRVSRQSARPQPQKKRSATKRR